MHTVEGQMWEELQSQWWPFPRASLNALSCEVVMMEKEFERISSCLPSHPS